METIEELLRIGPNKISTIELAMKHACTGGIKYFESLFKKSAVEITKENFEKAVCQLPEEYIMWMVRHLSTRIPREWFLDYSSTAYCLAREVEGPRDDTRTKACEESEFAFYYARHVDYKPCDETRSAVQRNEFFQEPYESFEINWNTKMRLLSKQHDNIQGE